MRRRIITQEEHDRPKVRRVVVVLIAGALLAAIAAWLVGIDDREERTVARPTAERPSDPLREELLRCSALGQPALDDPACRAAWAENRRRFFGTANRQPPRVNEQRAAPLQEPVR